jgi:glutamate dehydrogenase
LLGEAELAALRKAEQRLKATGVPAALALRIARLDPLYSALDILEVAQATQRPVEGVAALYFALAARLDILWLRERISGLPTDSHWQALARSALRDELAEELHSLVAVVLKLAPDPTGPDPLIEAWQERNRDSLERVHQVFFRPAGGGCSRLGDAVGRASGAQRPRLNPSFGETGTGSLPSLRKRFFRKAKPIF